MKNKIKLPKGWELERLEDGLYEVIQKPNKLEVGKDYIRRNNSNVIVIDRKNDLDNNGFYSGLGFSSMNIACSKAKGWREATESEVIEAFEKELVIRYGENWKDVKIKECMYFGESDRTNTSAYNCYIKKDDDFIDGWSIWNKNGCLYLNGKWAEVLEEPKYAEKLEDVHRPFYIGNYGVVYGCFFPGQSVNHFTTKERAEQVLALIQLIAFRDDIWAKGGYGNCGIKTSFSGLMPQEGKRGVFSFKDKETCEYFIEKHRHLLEIYSGIFKK